MRPRTVIGSLSCVCVLVSLALSSTASLGRARASEDSARPFESTDDDCDANGALDADEIAGDPVLDANFNGKPDRCEGLSVDRLALSVSAGGAQTFTIDLGPGMAGEMYWILGTTAGTEPGIAFGFTHLPLNDDAGYLRQTLGHPNEGNLTNTVGLLDAFGRATASASLAADSDPTLAGTIVNHSFVIIEPVGRFSIWASNAVSLELVP